VSRVDPPVRAGEKATLLGYLEFGRETLALKCAGLTPAQLAQRPVRPSGLSLLGLVRHLAEVELMWFQNRLAGGHEPAIYVTDADIDADFHGPADPGDAAQLTAAVEADFATWRAQIAQANAIMAGVDDLDQLFVHEREGHMSVRWLLLHMIEEYARHNGHADLLREAIDGVTGE
jgi:uncharacterized damage-inducible protein DinB